MPPPYRDTKQERAKRELEARIESGAYRPGAKLPTIARIAGELGLTHMPVRKAIERLVRDGKVFTVNGKGVFVREPVSAARRAQVFVVSHSKAALSAKGEGINGFISLGVYGGIREQLRRLKADHEFCFVGEGPEGLNALRRRRHEPDFLGVVALEGLPDAVERAIVGVVGASRWVSADFSQFPAYRNEVKLCIQPGLDAILNKAFDLGHRRFAFLYGERLSTTWSHLERFRVVLSFFQRKGLPIPPDALIETAGTSLDGYRAATRILDRVEEVTAIVAATDERAKGVLQAVRDRHLRIGHDVSVIGFDDMPEAEGLGLATVRAPYRVIGQEAVSLLQRAVRGKLTCERTWIETVPVFRPSLGPPPKNPEAP